MVTHTLYIHAQTMYLVPYVHAHMRKIRLARETTMYQETVTRPLIKRVLPHTHISYKQHMLKIDINTCIETTIESVYV